MSRARCYVNARMLTTGHLYIKYTVTVLCDTKPVSVSVVECRLLKKHRGGDVMCVCLWVLCRVTSVETRWSQTQVPILSVCNTSASISTYSWTSYAHQLQASSLRGLRQEICQVHAAEGTHQWYVAVFCISTCDGICVHLTHMISQQIQGAPKNGPFLIEYNSCMWWRRKAINISKCSALYQE